MVLAYLKNKFFYKICANVLIISCLFVPLYANKQVQLIQISEIIRKNEIQLAKLHSEKEINLLKQQHIKDKLTEYHTAITDTIISAYKLSNLPLKLLLNNNKNTHSTALAYSLLVYYNNFLKNRTSNFLEYIDLMEQTNNTYLQLEQQIKDINVALVKDTNYLQEIVDYNKTSALQKVNSNTLHLSQQSNKISYAISTKSNKPLLLNYEKQEDLKIETQQKHFVWPVSGYVQSYYHKADNAMYNNGITIIALPDSQIISPMNGEIVFVDNGNYLGQKNIIIIKHSASYYSLIIGDFKPFITLTQLVKTHEPIAITNTSTSMVYFEMQYQNQSIDPINWLKPTITN